MKSGTFLLCFGLFFFFQSTDSHFWHVKASIKRVYGKNCVHLGVHGSKPQFLIRGGAL